MSVLSVVRVNKWAKRLHTISSSQACMKHLKRSFQSGDDSCLKTCNLPCEVIAKSLDQKIENRREFIPSTSSRSLSEAANGMTGTPRSRRLCAVALACRIHSHHEPVAAEDVATLWPVPPVCGGGSPVWNTQDRCCKLTQTLIVYRET